MLTWYFTATHCRYKCSIYRSFHLIVQCIRKSRRNRYLMVFRHIYSHFLLIVFASSESMTSKIHKIKKRLWNSVKYRQNYTRFRFSYCFFGGHFEWRHNMLLSAVRVCYPPRRGPQDPTGHARCVRLLVTKKCHLLFLHHFRSPWLADYYLHTHITCLKYCVCVLM